MSHSCGAAFEPLTEPHSLPVARSLASDEKTLPQKNSWTITQCKPALPGYLQFSLKPAKPVSKQGRALPLQHVVVTHVSNLFEALWARVNSSPKARSARAHRNDPALQTLTSPTLPKARHTRSACRCLLPRSRAARTARQGERRKKRTGSNCKNTNVFCTVTVSLAAGEGGSFSRFLLTARRSTATA